MTMPGPASLAANGAATALTTGSHIVTGLIVGIAAVILGVIAIYRLSTRRGRRHPTR
jgi:H+/gluconate symporter-like permease